MDIGKTLYVTTRKQWRAWLQKNHATVKEIWLVYCTNESGKPSLPYEDSMEEALILWKCRKWLSENRRRALHATLFAPQAG